MIDQLQLTDNWKSSFQKNCETFFLYPAIRIYHKSCKYADPVISPKMKEMNECVVLHKNVTVIFRINK